MLARAGAAVTDKRVASLIGNPHVLRADLVALVAEVAGAASDGKAHNFIQLLAANNRLALLPQIDREVDPKKRLDLVRQAEAIMEEDPPLLPVSWEKINDGWYNYVKGHNPKDYFGIYDVVRFDTFWLDK